MISYHLLQQLSRCTASRACTCATLNQLCTGGASLGHSAPAAHLHTSPQHGVAVPGTDIKLEDPRLPLPRFLPQTEKHRPLPSPLPDALHFVKATAKASFDETVDLRLVLGTDPRRGDQAVRGTATLPHGTGRSVRVAVFADPDDTASAKAAGADIMGDEALIDRIAKDGNSAIEFDKLVATKSSKPLLSRVARILGPRGLMPNPKLGTLTDDVAAAVRTFKAGRIDFRADRGSVLHAGIGKASFSVEALEANALALVRAVMAARPKGVKGGGATGYMLRAGVSSTMGPGFPVNTSALMSKAMLKGGSK